MLTDAIRDERMKHLTASVIAAVVFACSGSASATADYKASLYFDGGLPALRTGGALDGPHNLDGAWTTSGIRSAHSSARDQLGVDGSGDAVWDTWRSAPSKHNYQNAPTQLGEIISHNPALGHIGSGTASINTNWITTNAVRDGGGAELDLAADWKRGFSLAAGESMTFTSLCTLDILGGEDAPLDSVSWFNLDAASSFAKLTMADTANRVGASLSASLTSLFGGSLSDVFHYAVGSDGRLTLSVTNATSSLMTGWLGAGTYVDVSAPVGLGSSAGLSTAPLEISAPVPEPMTVAMMMLGLGVIGAAGKRRSARR
ncbi:hypothetical protein ASC87_03190 [Rhizobacter sp. Root1221]|nr:hypothetical protein ASC87_03190 [Rhizobacter sp. Root1221]